MFCSMDEMDDRLEEINETLIYPAPVSFRVNFFLLLKIYTIVERYFGILD